MSNVVALSVNVSVKSETKNENTHQFHLVWKLCFRICCHLKETHDLKEMHCVFDIYYMQICSDPGQAGAYFSGL